jgi:hypothetical protein
MSKSTEALKQTHARLTDAVQSIVTGDDWQRMLRTAAKFHRYSFPNLLLISFGGLKGSTQRPGESGTVS